MTVIDIQTRIRHNVVTQMCYTKRHDYGLDKIDDYYSSGMTEEERLCLYREMDQLYEHHIKPFVEALFKVTYIIPEKDKADAIAKMVLDRFS